jgi:hypothetical protein
MNPPLAEFSIKDLQNVAPGVKEKYLVTSRPDAKASVHCECALAVLQRRIPRKMEVGVSKDCCWPCLEFLARYSSQPGKIVVSATHRKTYQNWLFPSHEPSQVHDHVERTARLEFSAWLLSLNGRRTSDSHAASSPEGQSPNSDYRLTILRFKQIA